ncbi:lipocalin family protein [Chitinophaga eiseniae]|uniref:Lipocalin family protein n=1 Tax=Chitinophaga eiseniae TaxID=634771 RepID=A0A847SLW8_9BACT|nr:lipocalin family protein [Chitinophaga eiseniae]NLR82961.1 lipocalin family protein [Chitinophaga eiseniae]
MKTQTLILVTITFAATLAACNNATKQDENPATTSPATAVATEQPATGNKLVGKWVQPIPGQEPAQQGFQLDTGGIARSINMHTLLYDKWELRGDTLIMWNHTTGVKSAGPGIDTTIIKQLTDSTLVLKNSNNVELSYTRGK